MTCGQDTMVPENAELDVSEITPDQAAYLDSVGEAAEKLGLREMFYARVFDIAIVDRGDPSVHYQPQADVKVQAELYDAQEDEYAVVYLGGQTEKMDVSAEGQEIAFSTDALSTFVFVGRTLESHILASDGQDYRVSVAWGEDAGIPEGTELEVSEVPEGTGAYEELLAQAHSVLPVTEKMTFAHFFDISLVKDGEALQPAGEVTVKVELADRVTYVRAVHFVENRGPVLMEAKADALGHTVSIRTDGFSVYGVVGTTLIRYVLASDGHNYRISVTYGPETGIPENADLTAAEITEESDSYSRYAAGSEEALGLQEGSAGYIRLFDIKIVDEKGEKI